MAFLAHLYMSPFILFKIGINYTKKNLLEDNLKKKLLLLQRASEGET